MAYKNYTALVSKGYMYEKSKELKSGFDAVTTQSGISYQRKVKNIEGVVTSFKTKKFESNGNTILELVLNDGTDTHTFAVNLYTASGSNTSEAQALISAMYGYQPGERVTVSFSVKKSTGSNGKEYENGTFWINYVNIQDENGKNKNTGFIPHTEIPKAVSKVVAGQTKYNWDDRVEFFYAKLQEITAKIEANPVTVQPQAVNTAVQQPQVVSTIPQNPVTTEEDDDLPFG